jgi:transcriptional regulator with XRE-family HTH domain
MNKKIDKFKSLISEEKSGWLDKAKWREENEAWLDISFSIAIKILGALKANKKSNIFPGNQKELAEAMNCSAQYVNKVLKGDENLQLETISRIAKILNIRLVEVPKIEISKEVSAKVFTEYFENIIFSKEKGPILKTQSAIVTAKSFKSEKVEQKGLSYSALINQFKFEEDLDNDPNSPLKLVA